MQRLIMCNLNKLKLTFLIIPAFILLSISGCGFSANSNSAVENNHKEFSVDTCNLKEIVNYLASAELKGRLPGTEQYEIAGQYVETYFRKYNLKFLPGFSDYRQNMNISLNRFLKPCDFRIFHYKKGEIQLDHGVNYNFRGYTGSGELLLNTVFCGYGIDSENYNDYKNVDVTGKAVIIIKSNPGFSIADYPSFSISHRANVAYKHGASAVIFVSPPETDRPAVIGSVMFGDDEYIADLPLLQLDEYATDYLFEGSGETLKTVFNNIKANETPFSIELKSEVYINVQTTFTDSANCFNIGGLIRGTDISLRDEFLVVSAHLDHVGYQCEVIYPGANDNASGVAAVIELARLFSENPPARSIIFITYTGEEQGLIGASHFAENLPVDPENIIAAFNFDCIASGDSIQIGNGLSNPQLYKIALKHDLKNLVVDQTWRGGGADLTPLHNIGIPGLYFVTKYSYTHLHLPSDTPETLNIPLFKEVVGLGYRIINELAGGIYEKEDIVK